MRSRGWVLVTVVLILAVVLAGVGAAFLTRGGPGNGAGDAESDLGGTPSPSAPEVMPGVFDLRQVLFQESGELQRRPPLPPGPAKGGKSATRDLQRVDCNLAARPMEPGDNVILCDSFGFRYGLGPSEIPADAVDQAIALQGQSGAGWVVQVSLNADAAQTFADVTKRVATLGPPLNQLAIVLNGAVVSAPAVQEPISGGLLQITGTFTQEEAEALAASLA
ncbi:MAG: hypothetical protein ABI720_05275 [Actinomycetes bacterium]